MPTLLPMHKKNFFVTYSSLIFLLFRYEGFCKTSPLTTCMCFYVTEHFKAVECQSKQDTQVTVMCFPKGRKALPASLAFSICSEEKSESMLSTYD